MFGKSKKIVSVAYKEKLLAEIAHCDKRIEEALNKRKHTYFEDESFEELITNPYKFKLQPSQYELKQQEASLSERVSMTLELAMLTIMQSEVNIMVTPPEVRKPVLEDGVWHEVVAECKIDLVSFSITFYAHKPHRKFAPTRYRNVAVALVKPAHQKELAQSILPKLQLPNLALQVLQSYATAFRSRRTTLLELAERYADRLQMQAMPEGGYRVRFLDLIQVDWTLENLWSPVVPFCHRMKFEVEYMPKDYISAIGKLYKQFKDPSLETSERTGVLAKIFDICLQAAGPAKEIQDSFESDPETAGRLHERRTTIDQEPDIPRVEHSPKKPSGKENTAQNRKTDMAPPKTIPKKAKKSQPNQDNTAESRKSVKRAIENDNSNAKRSRNDENEVDNSKSRAGLKGGSAVQDRGESVGLKANVQKRDVKQPVNIEKEGLESNVQKKSSSKVTAKTAKDTVKATEDENNAMGKRDGKTLKSKTTSNKEVVGTKSTNKNNDGGSSKNSSEASSKESKKNNHKNVKSNDANTQKAGKSKNVIENSENTQNDKTVSKYTVKGNNVIEKDIVSTQKDAATKANTNTQNDKPTGKSTVKSKDKNKENNAVSSKNTETTTNIKNNDRKVGSSKKDDANVGNSKRVTKKADEDGEDVASQMKNAVSDLGIPKTKTTYTKDNDKEENATNKKHVSDTETVGKASSRSVASKNAGKEKAAVKNVKSTNEVDKVSKKIVKNVEKDVNKDVVGKTRSDNNTDVVKIFKDKAVKTVTGNNVTNKNVNSGVPKENNDKNMKVIIKGSEKNKVVQEKQNKNPEMTDNQTDKEKAHLAEKRKVGSKTTEQKSDQDNKNTNEKTTKAIRSDNKTDRNNDVLDKKARTTEPANKNIENNGNLPKKSTANNTKEPKSNPIPATNSTRILKENTNRDVTLQKAVENNKITQNTNETNQKNNMLNVTKTITKSKIIPISKLPAEMQIKIADKLKTKIPMMKKMALSSLTNKLGNNAGKISGVEKSKIPQKSLPVFKKFAKNLPTRISPRKLPTAQPSQGYSNK